MYPWEHKWRYVQMQQSAKPDLGAAFLSVGLDAAGVLAAVASDRSWRNALVLKINVNQGSYKYLKECHILECISGSLPLATYLDTDTNAFVDVFCAALIVDAELESVTVLELKCTRVLVGR